MSMIQLLVFYGTVIAVTSDKACDVCDCRGTTVNCIDRKLKEIPTDIPKNTTSLTLTNNQIREIPPTAFSSLLNLQGLSLSDNQITDIPPTAFSSLLNLQGLSLSDNQITEIPPTAFSSLLNLQGLSLSDNQITEIPPTAFSSLLNLRVLYIIDNPLMCDCNMKWLLYFRRMQNLQMRYSVAPSKYMFPVCSDPANMKGQRIDILQLTDIWCDCRIPGKIYKEKRNKKERDEICQIWGKATDETEYGEMVKAEENYCTNLYTDEPVCLSRNHSHLMPCDVPICSDNLCVNDEFLQKRYGFLPLYIQLQCIYSDLISLVPSSLLHCGLAQSRVKTIHLKNIQCPDHRTMTRALTLHTADSKQMFEKCYLLENNLLEFQTKIMQQDQYCLKYLKNIFLSETKEQFCRSISVFANCKLSKLMEVTDETITEYDKNFVVSQLQREFQHTGIQQYNCSVSLHTRPSENASQNVSQYSEDKPSFPITYLVDCKIRGVSYLGTQNMTERGFACQAWDKQYPHRHNYGFYPGAQENYCRDFDSDEPWCLTTNRKVVWDRCIVPSCGVNVTANFSWCASIEELNTSELKKEISCQSYCNWIRTTIDNTIAKENLQSGRSCEFRYKKQLIRNKEHLLERGTFTPWICSISIFDNKEDECTTPEYQYSDDQWNNVAFVVIGIYLMLVNVIVLSVGIHQMTKRLDIEIEQLEIRNQRELFDIACMLMHREIRCLVRQSLGQRSTRYQSIAEDHYELIPIPNDYEAPLQIPSILPGTEYQAVAPYEMRKEGCVCRYCLDQAAKDHPNSFPEIEGAHGTVREYESLEGVTTYLDGATSEKNTIYSLLNRSPDVSLLGSEGKAHLINDHSPSTRRRRSRRRMHRGRKPGFDDYDDGDFDRDLIPLEQIKQRHEDTEDADFISQLLSNVKRESTTDVFPGFSLFKIPETLPNFKRKEENESICLSEFSFLEVDYQEELNDIIDAENTEPEKLNFNTEMLKDDETYKTKEASKDVVPILHTESGVDDKRTRTTTGFCIAEVHFDAGNSEGESNTSDYLQPMSENSKKINSRKNQTHVIEEF